MKPRVLLIGDSIRMGYAASMRQKLKDEAEIIEIPVNGGDSEHVRTHLDEWLRQADADNLAIIHLNCGLHDIKRPFDDDRNQQPLSQYTRNLRAILRHLTTEPAAHVIWATTTPVLYERHHAVKGFDRFETDVETYNAAALRVVQEFDVDVNDLYRTIREDSVEQCLGPDGVHMTERGNALLATAVADKLRASLK